MQDVVGYLNEKENMQFQSLTRSTLGLRSGTCPRVRTSKDRVGVAVCLL